MSIAYDDYLKEHINAVQEGWHWIQDHIWNDISEKLIYPNGETVRSINIEDVVAEHDKSKVLIDEYIPYDRWFYGGNKSYQAKIDFQNAFLKHIHRNPHHWQHWILIHDDPNEPTDPMEIPIPYIFEMIADWWSFSWRKGDLMEMFNWYDQHKNYIVMHKNSRKNVEMILDAIKAKLEESQNANG